MILVFDTNLYQIGSETAMKEVSARRAQTRLALIEAATTVFAAKGVDVSVDEICAAAGFTRGAFYSNFSSKTELCIAVFDHYTYQSLSALRAAIPSDIKQVKSLDDLVLFIEKLIPFEDCHPDVALAMHTIWLAGIRDSTLRLAVLSRDAAAMSAAKVIVTELFDQLGLKLRIPIDDVLMMLASVNLSSMMDSLMTRQDPCALLRGRLTAVVNAVVVDFGQPDRNGETIA